MQKLQNELFDVTKVCLKTHSYIHIGGKDQALSGQDYFRSNNKFQVIDDARIGKALPPNLVDEFCNAVLTQKQEFKLYTFFKKHQLQEHLKKCTAYAIDLADLKHLQTTPDVRPFVRDGCGRPYIPGSTIKGALRTALIYHILKDMKQNRANEFEQFFLNSIKSALNDFEKAPKYQQNNLWFQQRIKARFADWLPYSLLQKFFLSFSQSRFGPHTDIMRAVKVSDSLPIEEGVSLREVLVMSPSNGIPKESSPLYVECIKPGIDIKFSVTLDKKILKDFYKSNRDKQYFSDIAQLFSYMKEFVIDQWEYEQIYMGIKPASLEDRKRLRYTALKSNINSPNIQPVKDFYKAEAPNFRLGWGCGLVGATVDLLLDSETRERLRNLLFKARQGEPAPKSRRLIWDSQNKTLQQPLGWGICQKI